MELIYIYIDKYRTFEKEEINLSGKFNVALNLEEGTIKIDKNNDYISPYPENIVNINGLIGRNASGKTSLLDLIGIYPEYRNINEEDWKRIESRNPKREYLQNYLLLYYEKDDNYILEINNLNFLIKDREETIFSNVENLIYNPKPKYSGDASYYQSKSWAPLRCNYIKNTKKLEYYGKQKNSGKYQIINFNKNGNYYGPRVSLGKSSSGCSVDRIINKLNSKSITKFKFIKDFQKNYIKLLSNKYGKFTIIHDVNYSKKYNFTEYFPEVLYEKYYKDLIVGIDDKYEQKIIELIFSQLIYNIKEYSDIKDISSEENTPALTESDDIIKKFEEIQVKEEMLRENNSVYLKNVFKSKDNPNNKFEDVLEYYNKINLRHFKFIDIDDDIKKYASKLFINIGHSLLELKNLIDIRNKEDRKYLTIDGNNYNNDDIDKLEKFLNCTVDYDKDNLEYDPNSGTFRYMFENFSTGTITLINIFSAIWDSIEKFKDKDTIILLFDEIENSMHPDLASSFMNNLIDFLGNYEDINFQIIYGSHSPFFVCDTLSKNITLIKKDNEDNSTSYTKNCYEESNIETFGQNIHVLISKAFLMENTLGKYSKEYIEKLNNDIDKLIEEPEEIDKNKVDELQNKVNIIGEDFIKITLQHKLDLIIKKLIENNSQEKHDKDNMIKKLLEVYSKEDIEKLLDNDNFDDIKKLLNNIEEGYQDDTI